MTTNDSNPADRARRADWYGAAVAYLAQGSVVALCAYSLAILVMVVLLWKRVNILPLLAWAISMTLINASRALHIERWQRHLQTGGAADAGARQFLLGTLVAAVGWAASWSFVPLVQGEDYRHFVTIILCAVAAGSVLGMGLFAAAERVFLSIVILPMIPAYWLVGSVVAPHASIAAVIFLGVLLKLTNQFNATLTGMIHHRFENAGLFADLLAAKRAAEALNNHLTVQVAAQQITESALIAAKEQAEQAARAKSEFLANMSHEIRTPMNGVLGMTELLLRTQLTKKQRSFTDTIRRSGENLLAIINDILDFSKIEAGKLEIQTVTFDLRTLIENVGVMFARRAEHAGVDFTCAFDTQAHATYAGDPDRIQQILNNLIGNALKFTREGAVTVRAYAAATTDGTCRMRFEVRDTGFGIAAEHQARIFDSFVQADGSTARKFGGTGLGLAICKQLTQLMGGEIGLESSPGRGSMFWFMVPLRNEFAGPAHQSRVRRGNFEGKRVLIAEANPESRELLELQLTAWRASHVAATSRDGALRRLQDAANAGAGFDCMIIDHGFAGDGLTFVAGLRRTKPFPLPKFLMLAGISALQETGQWMDAGIDAYVDKPIRQRELQDALAKVLQTDEPLEPFAAASPRPPEDETRFKAHLLVAEDNTVNQELMRGMLDGLGCRLQIAGNGREAVDAVINLEFDSRHDPYQLILMDCQMPELDGFAATRRIREFEQREARERLPIIAITANALNGDREHCLAAGMDDYLTKPFTRAQLIEVLQRWLPLEATVKPAAMGAAPVASTAAVVSAIDLTALRKIQALQRPGAPDILTKVIALYAEAVPRVLQDMRNAMMTADGELLQRAAHSLKSSSASLGATACAESCHELEALGRSGHIAAAASKIDVLEFELDAALAALRQQLRLADADAA